MNPAKKAAKLRASVVGCPFHVPPRGALGPPRPARQPQQPAHIIAYVHAFYPIVFVKQPFRRRAADRSLFHLAEILSGNRICTDG